MTHEYSTNADVIERFRDETEWAVKVHRRYVELRPNDAIALRAHITSLEDEILKLREQASEHIRRINTLSVQRDQLDAENLKLREQAGDMAEDLERANDQIRRIAGTD